MLCRHYIVEGRVQGVFFRASTRDKANQLGVTGWVRNLADGHVELMACGNEPQLDKLYQWLQQGPPLAIVHEVTVTEQHEAMQFTDFQVV